MSVKFLGFKISGGKLLPDENKIEAFNKLSYPRDKDQLRSALGTLRHYGIFCKNFSSRARNLYHLLKKNVRWNWLKEHEIAFNELKQQISKGQITCYDQNKPLFVFSDASKKGLGFVLSHDENQKEIVWLGSRVLSPAENNYSNIEREALALVEAVKYFHKFLAGRKFSIMSDHRPLKYIFDSNGKVSERISARLQRWAITLKAYDYTVNYIKGETMFMADTLSRIPSSGKPIAPMVNLCELNSLDDFTNSKSLLARIAASKDQGIQCLKKYITGGWPIHIPPDMLRYSQSRNEYSIQNGLIFKGLRIVPPQEMYHEILTLLHSDHPGINRMVRTSRKYFWWPKIDQHINNFVQKCRLCQVHANKRIKAYLSSWEEPHNFLERVHIDIGNWKQFKFLVFCDAYSKWVDVQLINNLSAASAVEALRRVFKYVGLPNSIVSDNGTHFTSEEFQQFLKSNFITQIFTPPGHHSSNGLVERMIQTFKNYIRKHETDTMDKIVNSFCLFINTSFTSSGAVPANFVFLQTPRTRLSAVCTEFKPAESSVPALVRVENKVPAPSRITRPCGTNTYIDERGRLVHRSDITPIINEQSQSSKETPASIVEDSLPRENTGVSMESNAKTENQLPTVRRSQRRRVPPDRLQYT